MGLLNEFKQECPYELLPFKTPKIVARNQVGYILLPMDGSRHDTYHVVDSSLLAGAKRYMEMLNVVKEFHKTFPTLDRLKNFMSQNGVLDNSSNYNLYFEKEYSYYGIQVNLEEEPCCVKINTVAKGAGTA